MLCNLNKNKWANFCFSTLLTSMFLVEFIFAQTTIPDLGDRENIFLTPEKNREIGFAYLRQLLNNPLYVDDHQLQYYTQSLVNRVGQHATLNGVKIHVNLIKSSEINAAAVQGGYITLNTGLFLNVDEESELASVIGHEIAHISQHHVSRLLARANDQKMTTATAAIGGFLLGGKIGGLAGITVANARVLSNQLSYIREFEHEADSVGMQLLVKAGFDPEAMGQLFKNLDRNQRLQKTHVPEFLSTHPLPVHRIMYTEEQASRFGSIIHQSSLDFYLIQARVRALYLDHPSNTVTYFNKQRDQSTGYKKTSAIYGLAMMLKKDRLYEEATSMVTSLIKEFPSNPYFQILQAQIDLDNKKSTQAVNRLKALLKLDPHLLMTAYYLAETLLITQQMEEAKKLLRYQIRRHPDHYKLYSLLTKTNVSLGLFDEAHQTHAEYYALIGDYKKAIFYLKLALKNHHQTDGYFINSVQSRIHSLEEILSIRTKDQ